MELDVKKTQLLMIRRCWNMKDLAERANITYATLSQNISGRTKATFATIGKLAKALDVEPMEILKDN